MPWRQQRFHLQENDPRRSRNTLLLFRGFAGYRKNSSLFVSVRQPLSRSPKNSPTNKRCTCTFCDTYRCNSLSCAADPTQTKRNRQQKRAASSFFPVIIHSPKKRKENLNRGMSLPRFSRRRRAPASQLRRTYSRRCWLTALGSPSPSPNPVAPLSVGDSHGL